jgi:cytochrome b
LYTKGYQNEDELVMEAALGLHSFAAVASAVLILVHIAAAIYSRIKGEGVWSSMVPILKEKNASTNEIITKISQIEQKIYVRVENLFTSKKDD